MLYCTIHDSYFYTMKEFNDHVEQHQQETEKKHTEEKVITPQGEDNGNTERISN